MSPPSEPPRLRLHRPTHSLVWPLDPQREPPRRPMPDRAPVSPPEPPTPTPAMRRSDPRWVLAVRTWQMMQGEVLTASTRRSLLEIGRAMGLRDFESSLILAIVQDQARRDEPLAGARRLVAMVPHDGGARGRRRLSRRASIVAAWVAAAMIVEAAVCWAALRAW